MYSYSPDNQYVSTKHDENMHEIRVLKLSKSMSDTVKHTV